jgi:hypothetical protein
VTRVARSRSTTRSSLPYAMTLAPTNEATRTHPIARVAYDGGS